MMRWGNRKDLGMIKENGELKKIKVRKRVKLEFLRCKRERKWNCGIGKS